MAIEKETVEKLLNDKLRLRVTVGYNEKRKREWTNELSRKLVNYKKRARNINRIALYQCF